MKGILLFLVALIPTTVLTVVYLPLTLAYYIFTLKFKSGWKAIDAYFHDMAHSIDQFANISLQTPLNLMLLKRNATELFGMEKDDTISYVIALNFYFGGLTWFGKFWAWFLNTVDKDHLKKAIANKRAKDFEALKRLNIT